MLGISRIKSVGHHPTEEDTDQDGRFLASGILPSYGDYEIVYTVAEETFSYTNTCSVSYDQGDGWLPDDDPEAEPGDQDPWEVIDGPEDDYGSSLRAKMDFENFADLTNYVLEEYATGDPPARYMRFGAVDGFGWGTHGSGFAVTRESLTAITETWTFEEQAVIDPTPNGIPGYWILDQDVTGQNVIVAIDGWEEYLDETWPQNEYILSTQACTGALSRGYGWSFYPWQFWRVIYTTYPIYQYDAYGNRVQEYVCLGRDPFTGICIYGEYRDKIIGYTELYVPACASLCEEAAGACEDEDEGKK